ncbi:cytochrome P450 [Mycobacterium sp. pW049]|uniref:cytochrome P450 n=1 Tax=[Mycobacterium] bulgaricum TaxID=3238985 RepID=UPI00351BE74D
MTAPDTTRLPWDAADPYPYYERRRREGDVVWDDATRSWLILGYRAAQHALAGAGWTSDLAANPIAAPFLRVTDPELLHRNMLATDGANHQRLRGAVRDVFTRSFIAGLQEGIDAIAAAAIDTIPTGAAFDFMSDIALPLPIAVAAAWLGLEIDSARLLREESHAVARMLSDIGDPEAIQHGAAALATLLTEFLPLAADRRAHPGDDLLSFIATGADLELDDVVVTAVIIAVAGHETTANLLGAGLVRLLALEEQPAVDADLITELLRLDGPVQAVARTATRDQTMGDVTIRAGEPALVVLASANRDPLIFDDADSLRPDRKGPAPLSFGYGAHYCLGSALARSELTTALRRVLGRTPALVGAPVWRDTPAIRGPQSLAVAFGQNSPR